MSTRLRDTKLMRYLAHAPLWAIRREQSKHWADFLDGRQHGEHVSARFGPSEPTASRPIKAILLLNILLNASMQHLGRPVDPSMPANARAYTHIRGRLVEGDFAPGSRLPIEEIAEVLEISKQPVMEAVRRLAAEGYVDIKPQVGTIVIQHDLGEISDYFALFSAIEGEATALAAQRRSQKQLQEARGVSAEIGALLEIEPNSVRGERYPPLNRAFHSCIHRMTGTSIVDQVASGMYNRADFYLYGRSFHPRLAEVIASRHAEHEEILHAIEVRDVDLARALAIQHVSATVSLMAGESAPRSSGGLR